MEWNFWEKEHDIGTERPHYTDLILKLLKKTNQIICITGVRRSGKSTIMKQVIKKLIGEGTSSHETLYINFEDDRFLKRDMSLLRGCYELYLEKLLPNLPYLFLDEVQEVEDWERFARSLHERKEAKLCVSGSSSKLLSEELATLLSGRHVTVSIYPLGFGEFLEFEGIKADNELEIIANKHKIRNALNRYVESGGFPEVVLSEEKTRILLSYYETVITKDVVRRYRIREVEKLETLAKYYLTNISSSVTFNRISRFLKIPLATVERFSYYLKNANLIFFISRFSHSVKEQENSPRKVYSVDVGLSNAIGFRFSENLGRIIENIVAIELMRKKVENPLQEIYYWRDHQQREVDFVLKEGPQVKQLVQVCYSIEDFNTKERELKSLVKASKELKCNNLLVITWDYESEEDKGEKIQFTPLWKWLLI